MKTIATNLASRVITSAVQSAQPTPPCDTVELELSEEQAKQFPAFIAARNAYNAADSALKRARKDLGLPTYESNQTVLLYAFVGKGRKRRRVCIGEIQCSPRAGYPVPPGWQNKVVDKLTPELAAELTGEKHLL